MYLYDFIPMLLTLAISVAWYDLNTTARGKTDVELGGSRGCR